MARPIGNKQVTEQRRLQMLLAAISAFAKNGYSGSSLKTIADSVGVTEAALLHHFGTKAGLMAEVLQYRDITSESIVSEAEAAGFSFPRTWIEVIKANVANRGLVELFAKMAAEATNSDHPAHAFFLRRYFKLQQQLTDYFSIMQQRGDLTSTSRPSRLSLELIALSDGLQNAWLMDPDVDMVEIQVDFFRDCTTVEAFAASFPEWLD